MTRSGPKPQVSVVLTTYYHRPDLLTRAIESVLNQTLTDFEFIIVNDGAPEGTKKILNNYANQDSRIKVIHQQNKGLGQARNLGVRQARAPYVAFMDDDDRSLPRRLEEQRNFLQQHAQFAACMCFYYAMDATSGGFHRAYLVTRKQGRALTKEQLRAVSRPPFSLSPMTMITKEAFEFCGGYRPVFQVMEDLDFTLRFQEQFRVGVIPKPLYEYTQPASNFRKNMTTAAPIQNLKYVLACYISAWYRRNASQDPVEQGLGLDEIIHLGSQLPKSVRFHLLYKCSTHPIKVFLTNPELSAADLFKLFNVLRVFDHAADLRFLRSNARRLFVILGRQRKFLDLFYLTRHGLRQLIGRIGQRNPSCTKERTSKNLTQ